MTLALARPLLAWAMRLFQVQPQAVRLDAGDFGLKLIAWIHTASPSACSPPLEPQAPKETRWPPTDLDRPGVGQTHRPPYVFWDAHSSSFVYSALPSRAGRRWRLGWP